MRSGRASPGSAHLPRGQRCGPIGGDNQDPRHPVERADQGDESELPRVQVPPYQVSSLAKGACSMNMVAGYDDGNIIGC